MNFISFGRSAVVACALLFLFFGFPVTAFSQQKAKYNLLWEIRGKGLKKPSYLFGTLHTRDAKAFNFSDSVIRALQTSQAFVMEVHPDSMVYGAISGNLQMAKAKQGEMQTFLESYLYGLARVQQKKIYGLEEVEEHTSLIPKLIDDEEEEVAEETEDGKLTELYASGNIDELWIYLKSKGDIDIKLMNRNKVMVQGIVDLLKTESLFAAVSAGHLAGEDGIISLLKKEGYALRAVGASVTRSAPPKIDIAKMKWYQHSDTIIALKIDFPSKPISMKIAAGSIFSYYDVVDGASYTAVALPSGRFKELTDEQFLDSVLKVAVLKGDVKLISQKKLKISGANALDVTASDGDKNQRIIFFRKNSSLYMIGVDSREDQLNSPAIEHFFSSLVVSEAAQILPATWIDYKNPEGAFSVKIPVKPEAVDKEVPNPTYPDYPSYQLHMFMATDKTNLMNYLIRYNDYPAGMYMSRKADAFEAQIKEFAGKGEVVGEARVVYKDGYEGRAIDLIVQGTYMEVHNYIRGNRIYLLLRQNLNGDQKPKDDDFFSSFKFDPYGDYKPVPVARGGLKIMMPELPIQAPENKEESESGSYLKNNKIYFAANKKSGGLFSLQTADLGQYLRVKELDTLYEDIYKSFGNVKDSLYKTETVQVDGAVAKDFYAIDGGSGNVSRRRVWIHKGRFYAQTVILTKDELESKHVLDFFANVKHEGEALTINLKSSKASLITENLKSKDSVVYKNALGALDYYKFEKDELPHIYAALRIKHSDDSVSWGARNRLINELESLNDEQTVPLLKELFNDIKNVDLLRSEALVTTVRIDSNNYDWYFNALTKSAPLKLTYNYSLFRPLYDSLAYSVAHFDQVLGLLEADEYRGSTLSLLRNLSDNENKAKYTDLLTARKSEISAYALQDLKAFEADKNNKYSEMYSYLQLLPKIGMPKLTDEFTKRIFAIDSLVYLPTEALVARILAGLPLDAKILDAQLDSLSTRMQIMTAFHEVGKLETVPQKYRKHEEFAKLLFYNYLNEDEDDFLDPQGIKLLGKVAEGEEIYYVFEYAYTDEEENETAYVAVCGAFDKQADKLKFNSYNVHSKFEKKTDDWMQQAKALITEMKK